MERQVKVKALMTAPRYESVWARNYIDIALRDAGFPLDVSGGVFYGQCMTMMMEQCVEQGVEYLLTVDFDSVFTGRHVQRLIGWAMRDEIDAVAAIQPKRGSGSILGAITDGERTIEWNGYPLKVDTMHFGLTVIDCHKLAQLPKPWFHGKPNAEGRWDDGKTDDDVSFWTAWKAAGFSAYVDPGTRLGHLEEMVTIFDEQMQVQHWYPKTWEVNRGSTAD